MNLVCRSNKNDVLGNMWSRIVCLTLLMPILYSAALPEQDNGPQPPCGVNASPQSRGVDDPPITKFWQRSDLGRDWLPPACTGWTTRGFSTLAATVGRFRNSSGFEAVRRRVGAISDLKGTRYW